MVRLAPRSSQTVMAERHATLLVNPFARGVPQDFAWTNVSRFLGSRGIVCRVAVSHSPAEAAIEARRSAAAGDHLLFVVGGDGSLRIAAGGLAGSQTALAAVPLGTVNVWAREVGIPRGLRASLEAHLGGQVATIDLGRAGDEPFILMASLGWDADVVRHVSASAKSRFGALAYYLQGARMLHRFRPTPVAWCANGLSLREAVVLLLFGNTRLYGGQVSFTPRAQVDDGELDMLGLAPRYFGDSVGLVMRLVGRRLQGADHVVEGRVREAVIETPGVPVQADGDYIGETPMAIRIEPGALRVSLPRGPLPSLFASDSGA